MSPRTTTHINTNTNTNSDSDSNTKQHPSNSNLMRQQHQRSPSSTNMSLVITLGLVLAVTIISSPPAEAFQYDIWFKYPHPYTVTEPITYCQQNVTQRNAANCQSSLPVYVNTLDSPKTLIPYTIGQLLDFCSLSDAREYDHSQHTEWDDNIRLAPFEIKFMRNEECKILCRKSYKMSQHNDLYRLEELRLGITRDYYHHWFTDTFPASWCYKQPASLNSLNSHTRNKECFIGFPIGYSTDDRGLPEDERVLMGNFSKPNSLFLFNHFDFTIFYESGEGKAWAGKAGAQAGRITAFRVNPRSIKHNLDNSGTTDTSNKCSWAELPMEIPSYYHYGMNVTLQVAFSYSVKFVEDEPTATWSQRWQRLESTLPGTAKGKWIIVLAVLTLLATAAPAAYAIARTILSDHVLIYINPRDSSDEVTWKLLAGDIFREPLHIGLFSVLVGSGCQFIASVLLSEFFSVFVSLLSTSLLVIIVSLFVLIHGFVGGYVAVRLYRTFGGDSWRTICMLVTALNPLVIFCLLVMSRNLLLLYNGSLMALNVGLFWSLFMAMLCFAFSLPSAMAGGNIAFKRSSIEFPVRPTANARELPEQLIWRQPLVTTLLVGIVPLLGFWYVEAYPFYDSGGYVITVITIMTVICLSISHCYYNLTLQDYRWWWRSYLACGVAAGYYFIHCVFYIFNNLFVDSVSNAMLYISFAFFICLALFLLTGTIGFLVTFSFLWQTYSRTNPSPDMNYAVFHKSSEMTVQ